MVKRLCACAEPEIRELTGDYGGALPGPTHVYIYIALPPFARLGGLAPARPIINFLGSRYYLSSFSENLITEVNKGNNKIFPSESIDQILLIQPLLYM